MPDQPPFIFRTPEQDREFAMLCARHAAAEVLLKTKSDVEMHITDPEVMAHFKNLSINTLRSWCRKGMCGKPGIDGAYWVTIEEVRRVLFQKELKRKKK